MGTYLRIWQNAYNQHQTPMSLPCHQYQMHSIMRVHWSSSSGCGTAVETLYLQQPPQFSVKLCSTLNKPMIHNICRVRYISFSIRRVKLMTTQRGKQMQLMGYFGSQTRYLPSATVSVIVPPPEHSPAWSQQCRCSRLLTMARTTDLEMTVSFAAYTFSVCMNKLTASFFLRCSTRLNSSFWVDGEVSS